MVSGGVWDLFVLLPKILGCWGFFFARAFLLGRLVKTRLDVDHTQYTAKIHTLTSTPKISIYLISERIDSVSALALKEKRHGTICSIEI